MSKEKHILDGTIDDADNAITVLGTIEEINSYREYEKENKDREGIYELLDSREEDLKEVEPEVTTESDEVETKSENSEATIREEIADHDQVVNRPTIEVLQGEDAEVLHSSDYEDMRAKLLNIKPEQLKKMNPDILEKYNISLD